MRLFNKNKPRRTVSLVREEGPAINRVNLEKSAGVSLMKRFDKAGMALSLRGLDGVRAEVVLLLDHSGSMYGDYSDGTVQALVERALGFALQVDVDGKVPVIRFDSTVKSAVEVTVNNYRDVVNNDLYQPDQMGFD